MFMDHQEIAMTEESCDQDGFDDSANLAIRSIFSFEVLFYI